MLTTNVVHDFGARRRALLPKNDVIAMNGEHLARLDYSGLLPDDMWQQLYAQTGEPSQAARSAVAAPLPDREDERDSSTRTFVTRRGAGLPGFDHARK
jgi:hypothetical protein